ncbi:MAG: ATP-binding protein [Bacteroidota bacterium]
MQAPNQTAYFCRIAALCSVIAILAGWPQITHAQQVLDTSKQITQYVHEVWETQDGLPQNSANALTTDQQGYLWVGTEEGLVRFDGKRMVVFDKMNQPAFKANDVVTVLPASDGTLYVGTRGGGVVKYDTEGFSHIGESEGLPSPYITTLSEDPAGHIWIGTYGGGLARLHDNRITSFGETAGFDGDFVSELLTDAAGTHWMGSDTGLFQLKNGQLSRSDLAQLDSAFITTLFQDSNQTLWIATRTQGLFTLNDTTVSRHPVAFGEGQYINQILEDNAGSLWLALTQGGLTRLSGDHHADIDANTQFAEGDLLALHQDPEGSLWIGTRGKGLHRLRNEKFTPFTTTEGLANNRVYSVYEQEGLGMWIGTAAGLTNIQENSATDFPLKDAFADKEILSVTGDGGPGIWIGTYGEGLFYLQGPQMRQFQAADGLPSNNIFALKADKGGALWIGTDAGVAIYRDGVFSTLNEADGVPSPFITAIEQSNDGAMWVGTYDAGFFRYQDGQIKAFNLESGLSADGVLSLYEDVEGVLWIGTYGGGLNRFELNNFTSYTTADGLHNDNVYVILEDNADNLWMTCNKGIFRVSKATLKQIARGEEAKLVSTPFGKNDGLPSAEATGGQQPAGWKSKDGQLWFPTIKGLAQVDPANLYKNRVAPPVVIESMVVDNEQYALNSNISLEAGTNKLHLSFTANSLVIPEKVLFQYKLEGVDANWSLPDSRREAFYNNLPPGQYTFHVKATNNDGLWNEKGASVSFYLEPFFYQTLWFKISAGLFVVLLLFLIYRMRIQQLKARQEALEQVVEERTRDLRKEKERTEASKRVIEAQADKLKELDRFKTRFFANISHEFRTPLTMIIGPLENALTGTYGMLEQNMKRQVGIMLRNAQRLLRLINQLLDLSKLEAGKMELRAQRRNVVQFLESVVLSCTPLADKKQINLVFDSQEEEIGLFYEPDKLEKVFFNLLSNALKFTPEGGQITMAVTTTAPSDTFEQGAVIVRVSDSGRGIPEKNLAHIFNRFHQVDGSNTREFEGTGIGLALVHELVLLHQGTIEVESTVGEGTTFIIHFPKGSNHLEKEQLATALLGDDIIAPDAINVVTEMANESTAFDHEQQADTTPAYQPDEMIGDKVVLVVDDNDDVREYVSGILSAQYTVHTAVDGVDGLEKVASINPDLVISDVMMPRMDGNELCKQIKQNLDYDHIPVILMTAKATNALKIEGLEMGADDYIAKPFNARELLVRARNLMIMRHQEKELKGLNDNLEQKVADQLAQMLQERLAYEEELLVEKEKAETSSRLKSNILDNVNHEFRTPIAGIMGSAEILEMDAPEQMQEFVGFIKQSAYRLQSTLDAVVELSNLEHDAVLLNIQPVNLLDVAKDAVDRFKPLIRNKGLLFYPFLGEEAVHIEADEYAIKRILDHLLDNAVKFTHDGKISIDLDIEQDLVSIMIKDTGIGIANEFMPRLFDAFVQESDGISRSYEGIGIGLSISKRLAELMQGNLDASSEKNVGSTFILSFPIFTQTQPIQGAVSTDGTEAGTADKDSTDKDTAGQDTAGQNTAA